MEVRNAIFAGSWYPADADACRREIESFLEDNGRNAIPAGPFRGGIVPHAGWYFSGKIACRVIHALASGASPDVVLVFGMHLHPGSDAYITLKGAWETPFGPMPIEERLAEALAKRHSFRVETTHRFTQDNTIELQLPFIRHFFPDAAIVPMGVPPAGRSLTIGRAAVEIAGELGLKALVVGSTDLTHYGPNYGFSPHGTGPKAVDWVKAENDRRIIDRMLAMDAPGVIEEGLAGQNACCAGAAATAIEAARALGASRAHELSYATSYDKSPGSSFVGYVGMLFE